MKTQATSQPFDDPLPNGSTVRRDVFPGPPAASSSHPSLPLPYTNGANGLHNYDMSNGHAMANDWSGPPPHGQLEGPGMPVTRNAHTGLPIGSVTVMTPILPMGSANDHPASAAADTATEAGEGEGEGDDRTYCFCDGVSYGEMIACDDEDCEREWVRFYHALSTRHHLTAALALVSPQLYWPRVGPRRVVVLRGV